MAEEPLQNQTSFRWNKARIEAAKLLAEDELTDAAIAEKVGVTRQTIWDWKKRPEFAARVKELTEALGDISQRYAIGRRSCRIAALDDRWERMKTVIRERAIAREMKDAAGGTSGVLAHTVKSIGSGPAAEKVDEYEFDAALMKELREHEKQAAQELGQWTEKREYTNPELDALIAREIERLTSPGEDTLPGGTPENPDAETPAQDSASPEGPA